MILLCWAIFALASIPAHPMAGCLVGGGFFACWEIPMKHGPVGGREDNWSSISDGAGMTKEELRKVPPIIGVNQTTAKRPPPRKEEPPDAA
jgi:hypothetical protein